MEDEAHYKLKQINSFALSMLEFGITMVLALDTVVLGFLWEDRASAFTVLLLTVTLVLLGLSFADFTSSQTAYFCLPWLFWAGRSYGYAAAEVLVEDNDIVHAIASLILLVPGVAIVEWFPIPTMIRAGAVVGMLYSSIPFIDNNMFEDVAISIFRTTAASILFVLICNRSRLEGSLDLPPAKESYLRVFLQLQHVFFSQRQVAFVSTFCHMMFLGVRIVTKWNKGKKDSGVSVEAPLPDSLYDSGSESSSESEPPQPKPGTKR